MEKKKILMACGAFVIALVVGFGITKLIMPSASTDDTIGSGGSAIATSAETTSKTPEKEKSDSVKQTTGNGVTASTVDAAAVAKAKAEAEKKAKEDAKKAQEENKHKNRKTASQLTAIINGNGNDYPRGIVINVVGNGPNEHASSIAMIRQYKKMGTWSNITVTNVDYDDNDNVRGITIRVTSNGSNSSDE